jgi:hypothetical protein
MKTYHICSRNTMMAHKNLFCPRSGAHYLELPGGDILICCNFESEHAEATWNAAHGVDSLPHPMYEGTEKLQPRHHHKLTHFGIDHTHTILDVARIVGAHNPAMRLVRYSKP